MPAPFDSYDQLQQAEDIQDEIYIISPIDNPVCSMSRTIRANGKLHGYTEDSLKKSGRNAQEEGADATFGQEQAVVPLNQPTQIMTKTASVTGTLEEVDKYGRDSEMAYQLELRYGELANDEELATVGNPLGTGAQQTKVISGAVGTPREFASFSNQLDASVKASSTVLAATAGGIADLEAELQAVHLAVYGAGGNPGYLFASPTQAQYIAAMAYASGRQRDIRNERRLVNVIDLYVSFYGELDVVLNRQQVVNNTNEAPSTNDGDPSREFLLVDFNYTATAVLRPTRDWPIAKLGDSDRRQILREGAFLVLNTKAHGALQDIVTGIIQ